MAIVTTKKLKINLSLSIIFKGLAVVIGVLTVPAYVAYFEEQSQLGLWFAIVSILNWILFFDLGLGNGLKNELIKQISKGNYCYARELIKKTYILLIKIVFILSLLVTSIVLFFDKIIGFSTFANDNYAVILILFLVVLVQFPLKLSSAILLSLQKSALSNLIPLVTQLILLAYLLLALRVGMSDNLLILAIAYGVSVCVPLVVANIYIYKMTNYWNSDKCIETHSGANVERTLIFVGGKFFIIQMLLLAVNGTNEFLILYNIDAASVVDYQIYYRVYSVFLVVFTTLTIPMWSAIREASLASSENRISNINKFLLLAIVFIGIGIIALGFILNVVFDVWLGHGAPMINFDIIATFSVYTLVLILINYSACFCNSYNKLNPQLIGLLIAVLIKSSCLILFHEQINGWEDLVIITTLSLFPSLLIQLYAVKNVIAFK